MIGRNGEVIGRGNALEHAAGEIVFRPVAGAEEAARPIRRRVGRIGFRVKQRNAAKVGADADDHQNLRFDRTAPVGCVGRLLRLLGVRIAQAVEELGIFELLERRPRPLDDEHRPRRPQRHDPLAGLKLLDVDIDRAGRGDRGRVRIHLVDERPDRRRGSDRSQRPGHQKEEIPLRNRGAPMAFRGRLGTHRH